MSIKIFNMNDDEWYAGEDLESCIKDYFKIMGEEDTPENRAEYIPEACELDDKALDRMKYHDFEGNTYTFREALNKMIDNGCAFPQYFACSNY